MKAIIFGATGMVGQAALLACLRDAEVTEVVCIGRNPSGNTNAKVRDIVQKDLFDFSAVSKTLGDFDACFFCLGVSSAGMNEQDYTRITHDIAVAAGKALASPKMTFVFISGANTDSTEKGKTMWARVKGKTENALLAMPFKAVYCFRPAFIESEDGIQSRTTSYRVLYTLLRPLVPLVRMLFPKHVTTTRKIGRAMLKAARQGAGKHILENTDINALAG